MERFEAKQMMVRAEGRSKRKRERRRRKKERKKKEGKKKDVSKKCGSLLAVVALSSWVSGAVIS